MADEYLQAGPYPEQTALELKLKVDEVDLALHQFHQIRDRFQEVESRFRQMTQETAEILSRWSRLDQQHANAIAALNDRLTDWSAVERKLLSESSERIKTFERSIEHEWAALRHLHEEPLKNLEHQETALRERVLDMAKVAMASVQIAENRFASHAHQVERRLAGFARESAERQEHWRDDVQGRHRSWRRAGIGALVAALALGAYAIWLQLRLGDLEASLNDTTARVVATERQERNGRDALARDVAAAELAASRAVRISAILAAPDLRQVDLVGQSPAPRAAGRALWSRSRGLVINATGLPPPAAGSSYQAWIVTPGAPVSAGAFVPDPQGEVSAVFDPPPSQARLLGVVVTLEPKAGLAAPTGPIYLSSSP